MNWKKKIAKCTILLALVTLMIHIINKIIYFMSTIDNLLGKRERLYYEWKFGKIFYKKQGSGKPVLLIHDLTACSSEYEWNQIVEDLSETNTVYSLDLLGCGESDKPNLTYTNFLYVQLITDFVKDVIGEKVDVVATGFSSSFVLMACRNDKSVIDKVMLINPPSVSSLAKNPTKKTKMLKCFIHIPFIGTFLFNLLHNKESIEQTFMADYFYSPQKVDDEVVKTYCEAAQLSKTHSKYLFASIKGRFVNVNIVECLRNIDNRMYILIGNGNPTYKEIAEEYKNYNSSIEIQGIDKTKHLPQLEAPEQTIEQIKKLLEL